MAISTAKAKQRAQLLKNAFWLARHQHGMDGAAFRQAVQDWGFPRLSQCEPADLRAIISRMKRWYTAKGRDRTCSQSQLDYMQLLWEKRSRLKTKQSLDQYLINKFGVMHARLMSPGQCSSVIQSLKKWR